MIFTQFKYFALSTLLLAALQSCVKAELKKPTEVKFGFDHNSKESSSFQFTSGETHITKMTVSGSRIEGDDIYFDRDFSESITTDLNGSAEVQDFRFDIPQGEYEQLKVSFIIKTSTDEPALKLSGKYVIAGQPPVNVEFELHADQYFDLIIENQGGSNVVLQKEQDRVARIIFDTDYWFDNITESMMSNADVINNNGLSTVFITPTQNENLYQLVLSRVNHTNTVEIN